MKSYLTAQEAIKILGIPPSTFYRFVREEKIKKVYPTTVSKHGVYDAKEIARLKSRLKAGQPVERGQTDWIQPSDMGAIYDLEFPIYGDETGNPTIVRKWFERNPTIGRVIFNQDDRRDLWGVVTMLPLCEERILSLLKVEMRDVDLNPSDILTFDQPGAYDFYVASVLMRPDKRLHFMSLVNSIFDFWCEQAPERTIRKIYGRVVSLDGELIVRRLFFSPIWHVASHAYVLDLTLPNPSKIVQSFQYCVQQRLQESAQ